MINGFLGSLFCSVVLTSLFVHTSMDEPHTQKKNHERRHPCKARAATSPPRKTRRRTRRNTPARSTRSPAPPPLPLAPPLPTANQTTSKRRPSKRPLLHSHPPPPRYPSHGARTDTGGWCTWTSTQASSPRAGEREDTRQTTGEGLLGSTARGSTRHA